MRTLQESRPDLATATIVESGIALVTARGRAGAAQYLTQHRVPDAVIARVLCDPARRRATTFALA